MLQVRCANPTGTGEPRQPLRRCGASSPLTQGSQGNPSGAARQLPLHRGARETPQALRASSPYIGEPGKPLRRYAPAPPFAPKCPVGTFRCCAWLILRKEHTMLFSPKRTCFRFAARTPRVQGSQGNPSVRCGGQLPLHRGARATLQALLTEKRPRRRLLRGRWKRGIGIFTASGGCRPVRCGRR